MLNIIRNLNKNGAIQNQMKTKLTFKQALDKSIDSEPGWGMYIHFCSILQESGASRNEIIKYFNKYMPEDEFDSHEKKELIDYLVLISKDTPLD